ncbi:MAG: T9SS type A sorting domain-containing protein [Fibrobacteres bacterium]|nr:T9SS type A sorting domain-containing protein [Fibrobacterota bacterium]
MNGFDDFKIKTSLFSLFCVIALLPTYAPSLGLVRQPSMIKNNDTSWTISFEIDTYTDVEVSIVNLSDSSVVRHLAAGVLGSNPPTPLLPNTLLQVLNWDGKNDYREIITDTDSFSVRVRAGMSLSLNDLAGGDPYTTTASTGNYGFQGGLTVGSDGSVFWMARPLSTGSSFLRKYSGKGEYLKTLFPLPGEKPVSSYSGWGIVPDNGAYSPEVNHFKWVSQSNTPLQEGFNAGEPILLPIHEPGQIGILEVKDHKYLMHSFNEDGSMLSAQTKKLVLSPSLPQNNLGGTPFVALTPDRSSFYLTGIFYANGSNYTLPADTGFWQDGRIYKVNMATRIATLWFSLDTVVVNATDRVASGIGTAKNAEIHGVAVDTDGRVFVCDRLNKRIIILDSNATIIRTIPVLYPDAIRWNNLNSSLYVTTRLKNLVQLLKFSNWQTDTVPTAKVAVSTKTFESFFKNHRTDIAICNTDDGTIAWVENMMFGVTLYKDKGTSFELYKDFLSTSRQPREALLFDRMTVDPRTENFYASNGSGALFKIEDWSNPLFTYCSTSTKKRIEGMELAIDPKRDYLYVRQSGPTFANGRIYRYTMDHYHSPAPLIQGDSNRVTGVLYNRAGFTGVNDKGIAIAPNGHLAVISGEYLFTADATQDVRYFPIENGQPVPKALKIYKPACYRNGGIQFDMKGNLYVGTRPISTEFTIPSAWVSKYAYQEGVGSIVKYSADGSLDGRLFISGSPDSTPTPAQNSPSKIYSIDYGPIGKEPSSGCDCRSARFCVDPFGRLIVPNGLVQKVSILDNAGNMILRFGNYGNIDDVRRQLNKEPGTEGKFYLSNPGSAAATDDYVYIGDGANACLLRIKKNFAVDNIPYITKNNVSASTLISSTNQFFTSYPNPFNPVSKISVSLLNNSEIRLEVYDIKGTMVRQIVNGNFAKGNHIFIWNGTDQSGQRMATGMYAYRLFLNNKVFTRKCVLSK